MRSKDITLKGVAAVNEFVATATKYDFDINLSAGRFKTDAKSLIGIFSLNLSKPVTVEVPTGDDNKIDKFFEEIEKYA